MGEVNGAIFLREPMAAQPRPPDTNALVRTFNVHKVPCATTGLDAGAHSSRFAVAVARQKGLDLLRQRVAQRFAPTAVISGLS